MAAKRMPVLAGVLREQRRQVAVWCLTLASLSAMYISFYPSMGGTGMQDLVDNMPEQLSTALGYDRLGTAAGWLTSTIYAFVVPVLLLGTGRPPKLKLLLILFAPLWVWWLYSMQQSRYLLPTLALLAPVAGYAIHRCTRSPLVLRSTARVAVAAWLIVVMAFNLLPVSSALPGVLGTMPTETYLAWTLAPYPLLDYLNRYAPPEAKVISYGEPRLFYLERDYLWGAPGYHRMIIYDTMKGPGDLLAAYNRLSITHIIYCPALLNRLSADREPVAPLLKTALEEGYLEPVLGPFAPGHYQLLRVTERGRAP